MYRCTVSEHVHGGVHCPNPMQQESKAANEWPVSTAHRGEHNRAVYEHQILPLGV